MKLDKAPGPRFLALQELPERLYERCFRTVCLGKERKACIQEHSSSLCLRFASEMFTEVGNVPTHKAQGNYREDSRSL